MGGVQQHWAGPVGLLSVHEPHLNDPGGVWTGWMETDMWITPRLTARRTGSRAGGVGPGGSVVAGDSAWARR